MRPLESVAALAGIGLAIGVLLSGVIAPAEAPSPPVLDVTTLAPATSEVVDVVVAPPPPPVVDALPPSVAGVLATQGHTELMSHAELVASLPPNVVGVLMDRDVVLRIAEAEEPLP